jgi:hypothetical protein
VFSLLTNLMQQARNEYVRTGSPMMLVDFDAAVENRENEVTILAKANHIDISKFERYQGGIYPVIRSNIKQSLLSAAEPETARDDRDSNRRTVCGVSFRIFDCAYSF